MGEPIDINQDNEWDGHEINGPLDVFWAKGHGHDPDKFIRAAVDYCLDNDINLPAIRVYDDAPKEMWQHNVSHQDSIEYRRSPEAPTSPRSPKFPITILDLEGPRRHGGTKCSVTYCDEPWSRGTPVPVRVSVDDGYMSVTLWLCRDHATKFPEPSYRVCLVPVGATIVLDGNADADGAHEEMMRRG